MIKLVDEKGNVLSSFSFMCPSPIIKLSPEEYVVECSPLEEAVEPTPLTIEITYEPMIELRRV